MSVLMMYSWPIARRPHGKLRVAGVVHALLHLRDVTGGHAFRVVDGLDGGVGVRQLEAIDEALPLFAGHRFAGGNEPGAGLDHFLEAEQLLAQGGRGLTCLTLEVRLRALFALTLQDVVPDRSRGERHRQHYKWQHRGHARA